MTESIERRFSGDLCLQPSELELALLDGERKVLAGFVLVENFADPHPDFVTTYERPVLDPGADFLQFLLRRLQQRLALMRTEFPEIDITARRPPFVGKVRR
jgi:hypothetical protein